MGLVEFFDNDLTIRIKHAILFCYAHVELIELLHLKIQEFFMVNDSPSWREKFVIACQEMSKNGETERSLPERGKISWRAKFNCPNCHANGIYSGDELEYGAFYECASARYCPSCQKIYNDVEGVNFSIYMQDKFLPIMKKKLMADSHAIPQTSPGDPCPVCQGLTRTFSKDLGFVDLYDNFWTVCINAACDWPGHHLENHEP